MATFLHVLIPNEVAQYFVDETSGLPLVLKPGWPKLALLDNGGLTISSPGVTPDIVPGRWVASVSIPNMNLSSPEEFVLRWRCIETVSTKTTLKDAILVDPQVDSRETDIVALFGDASMTFVLPTALLPTDTVTYQIYANNFPILPSPGDLTTAPLPAGVTVIANGFDSMRVTIPAVAPAPALFSSLLKVDIVRQGLLVPITYLYKVWVITPQLMLTMSQLEDYLNKSRIENIIPELRYTTGDLVGYMERGLNIFNMIAHPTYFNGLNMQGVMLDAHLLCSSYYALSAQLLAEGSLAFDFSGQGVSLNVDRTPQLEAALGRMEGLLDSRITPLKKELYKNGFLSGDGSFGAQNMNNPYAKGTLGVMNAATTRINGMTPRFIGRKR